MNKTQDQNVKPVTKGWFRGRHVLLMVAGILGLGGARAVWVDGDLDVGATAVVMLMVVLLYGAMVLGKGVDRLVRGGKKRAG